MFFRRLPPDPTPEELRRLLRRLQWDLRVGALLVVALLVAMLIWLVPIGVQHPAASSGGVIWALAGYISGRRRGLRVVEGLAETGKAPRLMGRALIWGAAGGALSYGLLASMGVDVPQPPAPLEWRLLGGLVFGSLSGLAAGYFIWMAELAVILCRQVLPNKRQELTRR